MAGYTRALDASPNSAILYANRAAAHIRLENFGSAIEDGTKAVELDPNYIKVGLQRDVVKALALERCHWGLTARPISDCVLRHRATFGEPMPILPLARLIWH